MSVNPLDSFSFQLEENIEFANDLNDLRWQLKDFVNANAIATNARDIGIYNLKEIIIGQKYFSSDPQKFKDIYRIVIDTGQLPNAALKQVAHNLSDVNGNWFFTRIYGTASTTVPVFIPMPNAGSTYPVEIWIDTTNVNINTSVDLSSFTSSIIVLEYYKF